MICPHGRRFWGGKGFGFLPFRSKREWRRGFRVWFALRGTLCPQSTIALLCAIAAFLGRLGSGLLDRT